jgi:hypothetical protein
MQKVKKENLIRAFRLAAKCARAAAAPVISSK